METTKDAFLDNAFTVLQPAQDGHRAGMDALMLASTVPSTFAGRIADFGAGCGVAGMAVACRCPNLTVDLIERDAEMAKLALQSIELPENKDIRGRLNIIQADLTDREKERVSNGLKAVAYEAIIANPPFNDENHRRSPVNRRSDAHHLQKGDLEKWVRTASSCLKGKGTFTLIVRPSMLSELLGALAAAFGSIVILPIHPKIVDPASRIIVSARLGARGALKILPAFILHEASGSFTDMADAIFKGQDGISLA